jgi:hypothetical protein
MTRLGLVHFVLRTTRNVERRLLKEEELFRQAAATVPTVLRILVVLGSIFLAFAQLIRPR